MNPESRTMDDEQRGQHPMTARGGGLSGDEIPRLDGTLAADLLKEEYAALVSLYSHTENTLFSIFNFYQTLLSATAGAVIVLVQINSANLATALPTFGILLGFAVMIGIIAQDAIVRKNVDLTRYALSINLIKDLALQDAPEVRQRVLYMYDMHTEIIPQPIETALVDRIHRRIWWMLPLGMQQLFVSVVNSLALGVIATVLVPAMLLVSIPLWRQLLALSIAVVACFIGHCIYANVTYRRGIQKSQLTLTGRAPTWQSQGK